MHHQGQVFLSSPFIFPLTAYFNYLWAGSLHLVNAWRFCPSARIAFGWDGGIFTLIFSELTLPEMICGWMATTAAALWAQKCMAYRTEFFFLSFFLNNVSQEDHGTAHFKVFIKIHTQFAALKSTCCAVLEEIYRNKLTPSLLVWACAQDNGLQITKLFLLIENAANSLSAAIWESLLKCGRGSLGLGIYNMLLNLGLNPEAVFFWMHPRSHFHLPWLSPQWAIQ